MNRQFEIRITRTSVYINGEQLKRKYTGSSRKCFFNKDWVVKVEWEEDRSGLWQCRKEKSIWKKLPKRHRKFFVPLILAVHTKEYDYVVQPRVKIRIKIDKDKRQKMWNDIICDLSNRYNLNDLFPDLDTNWGVSNGQPLIIDYGC